MRRTITWLGHASVRVEARGTALLTDPLLRRRMGHLTRRVPVEAPAATAGLSAMLISHVHRDHLDLPTLRALGRELPVVVPRGAGSLLRGFGDVRELDVGERMEIEGVEILATPATHVASRGRARPPSLGYVIDQDIYFAGDTDLFSGMARLGPLALALLPVWGWGPSLGSGHLDPARAAEALALLAARIAVPIHWGTYLPAGLRGRELLRDPPRDFARAAAVTAPGSEVRVLEPGGRMLLPGA